MASSRRPIDVTQLLQAWRGGDHAAFEQLVETVYAELHRIARRCLAGERPVIFSQPPSSMKPTFA